MAITFKAFFQKVDEFLRGDIGKIKKEAEETEKKKQSGEWTETHHWENGWITTKMPYERTTEYLTQIGFPVEYINSGALYALEYNMLNNSAVVHDVVTNSTDGYNSAGKSTTNPDREYNQMYGSSIVGELGANVIYLVLGVGFLFLMFGGKK